MIERRYKGVVISEVDILETAERYCKDSDLPDECEALAVNYDFQRQAFIIKVYHKDFEILNPGCVLPLMKIEPKEKEE